MDNILPPIYHIRTIAVVFVGVSNGVSTPCIILKCTTSHSNSTLYFRLPPPKRARTANVMLCFHSNFAIDAQTINIYICT